MPIIESSFQKMINDTGFFHDRYYSGFYNSLYKYSIELLYDDHPIPDKYIIVENSIFHQFPRIYKNLAKKGNIGLIKKMLKLNRNSYLDNNAEYVMHGAAQVGNIDILKWMIDNGYPRYERATTYAVKGNQFKTLKWLINNDFKIGQMAVYYAAGKGYMDILNFLVIDKKCEVNSSYAAKKGKLEIVKYLYSIDPKSIYSICDDAVQRGNLDILKFAYERDAGLDCFYVEHPHILSWLFDNNYLRFDASDIKENIKICENIARAGNFECLQILHSHGFPILNKKVFTQAVAGRNIKTIKWLHELGCEFDKTATKAAADILDSTTDVTLPILKLLVSWNCELDDDICTTPAHYGDLETLKYLHSIGCALTHNVIECAAYSGHLHIIIWCREKKCSWRANACRSAVAWNHINVLRWLRGFDRDTCELPSNETEICSWDERVCLDAIEFRHIDILKFAVENGCKFGKKSYKAALVSKNNDIVTYAKDHYSRIDCLKK